MPDLGPLWLSIALASVTTVLLLLLGTPLAWWLANSRSRLRPAFEAITALPLVLPPTVLGFYFLIMFSPASTDWRVLGAVTGDSAELFVQRPRHRIAFLFAAIHGAAAATRV